MTEKIVVSWLRPFQKNENGDILPETVRCSTTLMLDDFFKASSLMDILQQEVNKFSEKE